MQAQINKVQSAEPTRRAAVLAQLIDCILSWPDADGMPIGTAITSPMEQYRRHMETIVGESQGGFGGETHWNESSVLDIEIPASSPA